ncbi:MAG: hypothetical protein ACREBR_03335, partial [bacterium]
VRGNAPTRSAADQTMIGSDADGSTVTVRGNAPTRSAAATKIATCDSVIISVANGLAATTQIWKNRASWTPLLMDKHSTDKSILVRAVKRVISTPTQDPSPTLFRFQMTERAAFHNHRILKAADFDLHRAINSQSNSPVSYGSEFRKPSVLEPMLKSHPLWHKVRKILSEGSKFPLDPISDSDRKLDMQWMIERGNHKSALTNMNVMRDHIQEDVVHGHSLPIPIETLHMLSNVSVAPLGITKQDTINEKGEIVPKHRMTHDQSFKGPSGLSVNERTIRDELSPCMFGHCLRRIIHYIVDVRYRHNVVRIMMGKFDLKAAYRRSHLHATTATECCTVFSDLAFVALRKTFGATPCPTEWCCISELSAT